MVTLIAFMCVGAVEEIKPVFFRIKFVHSPALCQSGKVVAYWSTSAIFDFELYNGIFLW